MLGHSRTPNGAATDPAGRTRNHGTRHSHDGKLVMVWTGLGLALIHQHALAAEVAGTPIRTMDDHGAAMAGAMVYVLDASGNPASFDLDKLAAAGIGFQRDHLGQVYFQANADGIAIIPDMAEGTSIVASLDGSLEAVLRALPDALQDGDVILISPLTERINQYLDLQGEDAGDHRAKVEDYLKAMFGDQATLADLMDPAAIDPATAASLASVYEQIGGTILERIDTLVEPRTDDISYAYGTGDLGIDLTRLGVEHGRDIASRPAPETLLSQDDDRGKGDGAAEQPIAELVVALLPGDTISASHTASSAPQQLGTPVPEEADPLMLVAMENDLVPVDTDEDIAINFDDLSAVAPDIV